MIHTKITNVLIFFLIVSLWFIAFLAFKVQVDMQNHQVKMEIKAIKNELVKREETKLNDFDQPELEPENIYPADILINPSDIPGVQK